MTSVTPFARISAITGVLTVCGAAVLWAQNQTPDGTLGALIAEVRQLRLAVEESGRTQSQIQMLSVQLSAEQSRIVQLAARLDATRRDLTEASAHAKEAASLVARAQAEAADAADPDERAGSGGMLQIFKQQADVATGREQQLRAREAELLQAVQFEEGRWNDLIAKLADSVKR